MAQPPAWRIELRRYLTERINKPTTLGEIYDRVAGLMPMHTVARMWCALPNKDDTLASPAEMRWHLMITTLRCYDVTLDKPRRKGQRGKLPRETVVVVNPTTCPQCGNSFVSLSRSTFCSRGCGRRSLHQSVAQRNDHGTGEVLPA